MITHSDDGPDFEPDDPLALILRPPSDYLGPPPGRYEAIRRGAARRRLLRTAAGAGLACAVAALIALPLHTAMPKAPTSPTVPLAPPPASSPSTAPTASASSQPVSPRPSTSPSTPRSATPTGPALSTHPSTATPTSQAAQPTAVQSGATAAPSSTTRP
ncbi:hypothetical protein AB0D27_17915 [Streptomyces sp. NPDC048415]|uniref:hypothetical protein n=1 Tax=Streptomyces sp. NPDC048415 TaxID=3154822 RepID=UPI00342FC19C